MFKIGDIVRCKKEDSEWYTVTTHEATCKVIEIYSNGRMEVEIIDHTTYRHKIGYSYPVDIHKFELVHNIDTSLLTIKEV